MVGYHKMWCGPALPYVAYVCPSINPQQETRENYPVTPDGIRNDMAMQYLLARSRRTLLEHDAKDQLVRPRLAPTRQSGPAQRALSVTV